jgi:hypothetical protein
MYWSSAITSDQIASQVQVDTGAADDVVVTPKKMRAGAIWSFATNGYFFLPSWLGGFGFQWGQSASAINAGSSGSISFPLAFFSVFQAFGVPLGTASLGTPVQVKTGVPSITGVNFYVDGSSGSATPRWFALGRI